MLANRFTRQQDGVDWLRRGWQGSNRQLTRSDQGDELGWSFLRRRERFESRLGVGGDTDLVGDPRWVVSSEEAHHVRTRRPPLGVPFLDRNVPDDSLCVGLGHLGEECVRGDRRDLIQDVELPTNRARANYLFLEVAGGGVLRRRAWRTS